MPGSQDGWTDSKTTNDSASASSRSSNATSRSSSSSSQSTSQSGTILPSSAGNLNTAVLLNNRTRLFMKQYRTEISASSASLLSTLTAYPLDSVKTRMQAYKFPNFVDCVTHTYKTEGMHGFWRGAIAPLASITLVRTVSFSIYQKAKYTIDDWMYRATGVSPLKHANTLGARPSLATISCFGAAGATSGALITAISCPFELTKLNAQIAVLMENGIDKSRYNEARQPQTSKQLGTLGTAKTIIHHRGVLGLYSGFHLHLLRDTIGTALYFMTYESSKQLMANARGREPTSPLAVVVAGGLCGLVSWACIYPIDSAKSIYQRNVLKAKHEVTKRTKIQFFNRRMYRGLGVSMTRSCLINAIFFSVFELVKKQINRLEVDDV